MPKTIKCLNTLTVMIAYVQRMIITISFKVEKTMAVVETQRRAARGDFERDPRKRRVRGPVVRDVRGRRTDVFGRPIHHRARLCRLSRRRRRSRFGMLVVEFLGASSGVSEVRTCLPIVLENMFR